MLSHLARRWCVRSRTTLRRLSQRSSTFQNLTAVTATTTPSSTTPSTTRNSSYSTQSAPRRFLSTNDADDTPSSTDYSNSHLSQILTDSPVIACVGLSGNWQRPSNFAMKYMQQKGYRVIPVNPVAAGQKILGETVYETLSDIPFPVDIVDVFRPPAACPEIAREAVKIQAKVLWLQLGIVSEEAEQIATQGGLDVIMDRCPKIEFSRLFGELGWHGFNSNVISSRKVKAAAQKAPSVKFTGFDTKVGRDFFCVVVVVVCFGFWFCPGILCCCCRRCVITSSYSTAVFLSRQLQKMCFIVFSTPPALVQLVPAIRESLFIFLSLFGILVSPLLILSSSSVTHFNQLLSLF